MTSDNETAELIGLYVDNVLPEALRRHVEALLAADPQAALDAEALQATRARLQDAPREAPDPWFTDRVLHRLLSEHAAAQGTDSAVLR